MPIPTSAASGLDNDRFWLIACAAMAIAAAVLICMTYKPRRSVVFSVLFERIDNVPNMGLSLELIFALLQATALYVVAVYVYPDASGSVAAGGAASFVVGGMILISVTTVGVMCFTTSQTDIEQAYRERLGDGASIAAGDRCQLRRIYLIYTWFCMLTWSMIMLTLGILAIGVYADYAALLQARAELVTIHLDAVGRSGSVEGALREVGRLSLSHSVYREVLLDSANRLLGAIAMLSLVFGWVLGTRFQGIYGRTAVNVFRLTASFVLLFLLPVLVLYAWYALVSMGALIEGRLVELASAMAASRVHPPDPTDLLTLNDAIETTIGRSSTSSFMARMLGSWGGILLLGQMIVSRLEFKAVGFSMFRNLLPTMKPFPAIVRWSRATVGCPVQGVARSTERPPESQSGRAEAEAEEGMSDRLKIVLIIGLAVAWGVIYATLNWRGVQSSHALRWSAPVETWPGIIQGWTAYIYVIAGVLLPLLALVRNWRPDRFSMAVRSYIIASAFAFVLYWLQPVVISRPDMASHGSGGRLMELIFCFDQEANCMPSSHAMFAVLAALLLARLPSRLLVKLIIWGVAAAVCVSAVTTGQHYLIDVGVGVAVAFLAYALARWFGREGIDWPDLKPSQTTQDTD